MWKVLGAIACACVFAAAAGGAGASPVRMKQCRVQDPATGAWGPDTCPHAGGLDQVIYGDSSP